jgi:hypothetical protein
MDKTAEFRIQSKKKAAQTILEMAGTIRSIRLMQGSPRRDEVEKAEELFSRLFAATELRPDLLNETAKAAAAIYAAGNDLFDIVGAVAEAVQLSRSVSARVNLEEREAQT